MKKKLLPVAFRFLLLIGFLIVVSTTIKAQQTTPQRIKVEGRVLSAETKLPLPGASVTIKGSKKGVTTDTTGKFSIKVDKGQTIVIGFVGFENKEYKISEESKDLIVASLNIIAINSDEVVVIGYGTRKKSHLTGAVSKLTTDMYSGEIPVSRADQALMGKLAGVNVTTTDAQAGAAPTIQIRGATSITAGSDPLIVIDGYPVPTDLSAIDMNDVESIEVLKDAASAAIYGSRGGNGVILVTTKSGKAGKARVSVNVSTGIKDVYRKIYMPTLYDWKLYVLLNNQGVLPASGEITQALKFNANTNAQDIVFRQANFTNIQASISGGSPTFKYYVSANVTADQGVMIGNDYKKAGLKMGFNAKPTSKLSIDVSVTPSYNQYYSVPVTVQEAIRTLPAWMPVYHNDTSSKYTGMPVGSIANMRDFNPGANPQYTGVNLATATTNSPLQQLNGTTDRTTQFRNLTNLALKYDISKQFSFRSTIGIMYSETTRDIFQRSWAQAEAALDGAAFARSTSFDSLGVMRIWDITNENMLTYKTVKGKNEIDALAVMSEQYTNNFFFGGKAGNFATDDIPTLNAGTMRSLTSLQEERLLISFLGRINYAYDNKYLLSVSARTDGSSRFAPGNKWGFFPSVSAGWKVSNEKFFPENNIIGDLKLRASYGATGNENIGNYKYFAIVSPASAVLGNDPTPGVQLTSFYNNNLGWERTFSANYGIDMAVFKNKVRISLEYYNSETDKLLLALPILSQTGATSYTKNQGRVSNKGFEFELGTTLINKNNFKWSVSANGSTNKNRLLDFGGVQQVINQGDPKRANFFLTKVGSPLVQFYGFKMDSVVPMTNTSYWPVGVTSLHAFAKDIDHNGVINDSDRTVLGNPYPTFNWGFTSNFQYKNFDMSITIQGSEGAKVFNIDPYYFETEFGPAGSTAYQMQGYTPAQLSRIVQKFQTNYNIQDASFIALRNVNIGYTIPGKTMKKIGLSKLRFYASAANLWYKFASNYGSFNPEADNGFPNDPLRKGYQRGAVPIARTIVFGLNLDF
ncbi:SusC/RagA family TonB-linked outer membrane protein [Chitinophagaceae bacterium LWZ2-11]